MPIYRIEEEQLQEMLDKAADYAAARNLAITRTILKTLLEEYRIDNKRAEWVEKQMQTEDDKVTLWRIVKRFLRKIA